MNVLIMKASLILFGFSLSVVLLVLGFLSRKLGEAWGLPRYYLCLYAAASLLIVRSLVFLFLQPGNVGPVFASNRVGLISLSVTAAALTLSLIVTVKYWGWIPGQWWHSLREKYNGENNAG